MLGIIFQVFLLIQFLPVHQCAAEIYKYQDINGNVHFTADSAGIPESAEILQVFGTDEGDTDNSSSEQHQEQPASQDEIIVSVLHNLVKVYHVTHTYSKKDFFVCADMAMDVWNMIETKGINARIAVGNINRALANWREYNHAWVVAEVSPGRWLALETTRGTVVRGNKNKNYYQGYFFNTPRELKEYVERKKRARELSKRTGNLQKQLKEITSDYERELKKHNDLVDECEKKYADRRLSRARFKKYMELRDKIAEQATVVKELEGRGKQLIGIIETNIEELKNIERRLDQPVERMKFS